MVTAYELLPRNSNDVPSTSIVEEEEFKDKPLPRRRRFSHARFCGFRRLTALLCQPVYLAFLIGFLLSCQLLFNASYHPSAAPSFEINKQDRVYIAANIIDGELITGAWGRSLLEVVELIGNERVFVSIYGGPKSSLEHLGSMLECEYKFVAEEDEPLSVESLPHTTLPSGERRVKRIAYLAEVRNKALEPLTALEKKGNRFDKVLFVNDVYFDPEGAARLLWGTNVNKETEKAEYKAACAADFVTSWKYYDTFATRDAEGYSLGVPIYPWFPKEGLAISRHDVLAQRDNVRVRSCWGGMVAFDGRYFQQDKDHKQKGQKPGSAMQGIGTPQLPLRFRSEPEPFWDSSECCLVHADIIALEEQPPHADEYDTGIYMNPYVRTAYSRSTFRYLWLTQRFERLFSPIQRLINPLVGMPRWNYRREEVEGESIPDREWVLLNLADPTKGDAGESLLTDEPLGLSGIARRGESGRRREDWAREGYYREVERTAKRGGYCGVRQLLVLKEEGFPEEHNGAGGGNWDNLLGMVPPLDV